jgi:hypothetical protein
MTHQRSPAEARTDWIAGPLPPRLLSEPLVEHRPREADVPAHPTAGQQAAAHSLIDPARLDVQVPRGLLGAKKSILLQRGRRRLICRWSLHTTDTDPERLQPANERAQDRSRSGSRFRLL